MKKQRMQTCAWPVDSLAAPLRGSRLVIEDAALQAGTDPVFKVQDFLAIDRFTGGGRDGAKFDAVGLWRPAFTARLRLENPQAWELGWLALVLRDLAEGWLSVGFGRRQGLWPGHRARLDGAHRLPTA